MLRYGTLRSRICHTQQAPTESGQTNNINRSGQAGQESTTSPDADFFATGQDRLLSADSPGEVRPRGRDCGVMTTAAPCVICESRLLGSGVCRADGIAPRLQMWRPFSGAPMAWTLESNFTPLLTRRRCGWANGPASFFPVAFVSKQPAPRPYGAFT